MQIRSLRRELRLRVILAILLAPAFILAQDGNDHPPRLVRLPDAILLSGFDSRIGFNDGLPIYISTPTDIINLNKVFGDRKGLVKDLSRDGKLIVALTCTSPLNNECGNQTKEGVISTLALTDRHWTEYIDAKVVSDVSISPDSSKLAFVSKNELHIYDLSKRVDRILGRSYGHSYTWSPDNTELAYEVPPSQQNPNTDIRETRIDVVNINSGVTRTLVPSGQAPRWSPSGQWIAFISPSPDGPGGKYCKIVRRDGNDEQTVAIAPRSFLVHSFFGGQAAFWQGPVWSPDSSSLLLNAYWDWETLKTDIYQLDLTKRHLKLLKRDAYPVTVWGRAQ
jgi:dipeptidyl aminopeptidase/acylaminoacyl peptidase